LTGGFALAASRVWGKEHEIVSFVEIDPFCQKVLQKHWPDVPVYGDIKTYEHDGTKIDLLTGGFPCQPFSVAGKQRGTEDDRALWPEMLRIIKEAKPRWIIGENVTGIVNMELDNYVSDLEAEGYETRTFLLPACAVDAPHRRDRVWIVAYTECINDDRSGYGSSSVCGKQSGQAKIQRCGEWLPEPSICELDDGLPPGLVRYRGRVATGVKDRVNKLKALGNSIVPQCVQPIMECIREIEDNKCRKEVE